MRKRFSKEVDVEVEGASEWCWWMRLDGGQIRMPRKGEKRGGHMEVGGWWDERSRRSERACQGCIWWGIAVVVYDWHSLYCTAGTVQSTTLWITSLQTGGRGQGGIWTMGEGVSQWKYADGRKAGGWNKTEQRKKLGWTNPSTPQHTHAEARRNHRPPSPSEHQDNRSRLCACMISNNAKTADGWSLGLNASFGSFYGHKHQIPPLMQMLLDNHRPPGHALC